MKKRFILTIDEGTTSVRVMLYDTKRQKIKRVEREAVALKKPRPTWIEQDAKDIWEKTVTCLKKVMKGINPEKVHGLGIANQRETIVAWKKDSGEPLCNAINWNCRRTAKFCQENLVGDVAEEIREKTGLIPTSYFSATKIKWLLQNNNAVKAAYRANNLCIGTMETYLVYRLTNCRAFVTDVTNASRTMLFNIHKGKWDKQLLELFGIPEKILAKPVANDAEVGTTTLLGGHIKVAGLIADQQSSLLGQGCYKRANIKATFGTGCFMMAHTGTKAYKGKNNTLVTIASELKHETSYALEGTVFSGGILLGEALKNNIAHDFDELTKMAEKCEKTDIIIIPGMFGIGTPYWKMNTSMKVLNFKIDTPSDQIAKAVFETIAFRNLEVYEALSKDIKLSDTEPIHVDGGLSGNRHLMQMFADLTQKQVAVMNMESTCMGAIICTSLATGVYNSIAEVRFPVIKTYKPRTSPSAYQPNLTNFKKALADYLAEK